VGFIFFEIASPLLSLTIPIPLFID